MISRYDAYNDSGVEWIGEIPEHWEVRKLKIVASIKGSNVDKHILKEEIQIRLCNYTDVYKNDFINSSIDFNIGSCTEEEYKKFSISENDVIITKDSESPDDIGVPAFVTEKVPDLVCGYHLSLISTNSKLIMGEYLFRLLQTKFVRNYFEVNSNGITRFALGKSAIESLITLNPPISEQTQIVSYLDEKTALIDKLISVKQRKIELLKEKRTALINHAVTKGLNPNVNMKASGVGWIGEIPEHWKVTKLKYISRIESGDSLPSEQIMDEALYPVYGGNGVLGFVDKFNYSQLVLSIGRVGEKCGNVHFIYEKCWINDNSLVLDLISNQCELKYLYYSLTIRNLNSLRNQNTQPLITGTMVKNEISPVPPHIEQLQLISYLDEKTKEIDDLLNIEQKKIELLKEYRQSLISEVVTGKIRVFENNLTLQQSLEKG